MLRYWRKVWVHLNRYIPRCTTTPHYLGLCTKSHCNQNYTRAWPFIDLPIMKTSYSHCVTLQTKKQRLHCSLKLSTYALEPHFAFLGIDNGAGMDVIHAAKQCWKHGTTRHSPNYTLQKCKSCGKLSTKWQTKTMNISHWTNKDINKYIRKRWNLNDTDLVGNARAYVCRCMSL